MDANVADIGPVLSWLAEWQSLIRARDLDAARPLFRDDVFGFGTAVEIASGLDDLATYQWGVTWPRIEEFTFEPERGRIEVATDGTLAWVATPWTSRGIRPTGERFRRDGRATIVLTRADRDGEWQAVHTHFSLSPR